MLKIGDFSKLARISIRMLRHYDEIGLLVPKNIDQFTGYRYYGEAQLPVAGRINALKEMGFGLSAITEILRNYNNADALKQYLRLKRLEVAEQAQEISQRLLLLETALERLGKDDTSMEFNVTCKELPQRYVASVRQIIPAYDQEGTLWQIMMREIGPLHVQYATPCYSLAIFHDGEYKEQDVDVEIQMTLEGNYPDTEHVVFKTEPPVLIASAVFKGSYSLVSAANEAVANWVLDNGYEYAGTSFSIYHVSPGQDPNPENWVTEVCYPVRKK